tara:strand:- start:43 stop:918 length:876 start_codon:yes stop_codon:yes gene_type:complete
MKIKYKYSLVKKIKNYLLRKALFKNREKFFKEKLPSYAGLINEYISIDIMVDGVYDLRSIDGVIHLLKSKNLDFKFVTLIDIGANIGNHSVYMSKYFQNVIAFEPNPFTFELLKINTSQYSNIEINNFGLSSAESNLFLSEDKRNLGGSRIYNNRSDIPENLLTREISLKKLDNLNISGSYNGILIKLDVEGHEIDALKGSHNFIKEFKPTICFEQHASDFVNGNSPTISFLSNLDYKFYIFESIYDTYKFKLFSLLLKLIFNDTYKLVEVTNFQPKFYDSIISIHKDFKI